MGNRGSINNLITTDRKTLYIILAIVMASVLTLTVVYAALSTTLNINGQAEISAANWDIYLDNVQLNNNSATTSIPTISNKTTASFSTTLTKPGDFYEFTIDIVNDGSIDAMIESVTKTPELSNTQKKYLNYIVEYQNGEPITTKQLVVKESFVRLKVKIEFRNDISPSDLPTASETLNLSFSVNYVQSDENGTIVKDDGIYEQYKVGNEICIGEECFYVISSDEDSVTMLAKYNLEVGNVCTSDSSCTPIENPSGIQHSQMTGFNPDGTYNVYGTIEFSETNYWNSTVSSYPTFVYNNNSTLYNYVENYKTYLESQGAQIEEARLIEIEELEALGCNRNNKNCNDAPSWVYGTSYWTQLAYSTASIWAVFSYNKYGSCGYYNNYIAGVRPVIVLKY